jgi:hypothetical protein
MSQDAQLPSVRIKQVYRKMLEKKAAGEKRTLSDYLRLRLIALALEEEEQKEAKPA